MTYGWTHECELLSSHQWISFRNFIHILNGFKFKAFTVKAQRDLMRSTLENLPIIPPFSASTRFPDNGVYFDLHHSVPARILRQLVMALDYSDRQTEKGRSHTDAVDIRAFSNIEDAKVAFYSAVDSLIDICGRFPIEDCHIFGVYIQSSFETVFDLKWT
nr:putative capsid protein [Atrato Virga-like virus 5]QHA33757.1 putative capsid protein [Atrato Virga-like virus 5]